MTDYRELVDRALRAHNERVATMKTEIYELLVTAATLKLTKGDYTFDRGTLCIEVPMPEEISVEDVSTTRLIKALQAAGLSVARCAVYSDEVGIYLEGSEQ